MRCYGFFLEKGKRCTGMINVKFNIPGDALLPYLYIDIYIYIHKSNFNFFKQRQGMKRICQFKILIKKNNMIFVSFIYDTRSIYHDTCKKYFFL